MGLPSVFLNFFKVDEFDHAKFQWPIVSAEKEKPKCVSASSCCVALKHFMHMLKIGHLMNEEHK